MSRESHCKTSVGKQDDDVRFNSDVCAVVERFGSCENVRVLIRLGKGVNGRISA